MRLRIRVQKFKKPQYMYIIIRNLLYSHGRIKICHQTTQMALRHSNGRRYVNLTKKHKPITI